MGVWEVEGVCVRWEVERGYELGGGKGVCEMKGGRGVC